MEAYRNVSGIFWPFVRGIVHCQKFRSSAMFQIMQRLVHQEVKFRLHMTVLHDFSNYEVDVPLGVRIMQDWLLFEDISSLFYGLQSMYAYQPSSSYKSLLMHAIRMMEEETGHVSYDTTPTTPDSSEDLSNLFSMLAV